MPTIEVRYTKTGQKSYRARVRVAPFHPRSMTFDRKSDAKDWANAVETELKKRKRLNDLGCEAEYYTVADMIDRYIANELPHRNTDQGKFAAQLAWWRDEIGHLKLAQVKPAVISQCRDKLSREPVTYRWKNGARQVAHNADGSPRLKSPATVKHYLATLSIVFGYAVSDWYWVKSNPVSQVRKPRLRNARTRYLSDHLFHLPGEAVPRNWHMLGERERRAIVARFSEAFELPRYLEACQATGAAYSYGATWLYNFSVILLGTALRYSEARNLRWSQIDLFRQCAHIGRTKNGQAHTIALAHEPLAILTEMHRTRRSDTDYVFPRKDGRKPLDFRKRFEKAVRLANITDFVFHDLRHTAASYAAMTGASQRDLMELLNHKSPVMTKRYSHLSQAHMQGVVHRMNARMFAPVPPDPEAGEPELLRQVG